MTFADPQHVAFATTSYPTERSPTAGSFIAKLADALVASGWRVSVIALAGEGDRAVAQAGVRVELVESHLIGSINQPRTSLAQTLRESPTGARHLPRLLHRMTRSLLEIAPDAALVHAHWLPSALIARRARRPFVVTAHGSDLALAERAPHAFRPIIGARTIIVGTQRAQKDAQRLLPRSNVVIIPPIGMTYHPVPFAEADASAAVFVARLSAEKGVSVLAEAWRQVRVALPTASLHVVGDGPLRWMLNLPGVIHHGAVAPAQVRERIGAASVLVQASPREGFGIAALEAIASGRGVIATRTGIAAELLAQSPAALLIDAYADAATLAQELLAVLTDARVAARLSAATADVALPTWDTVATLHKLVYAEALSRT